MVTSSNGNIFRVTGPLCRELTGPGEFPAQRPVTRSLDVFFDLRLYKRLSKQSWGWWFQTPSFSLLRHCNGQYHYVNMSTAWVAYSPHIISIMPKAPTSRLLLRIVGGDWANDDSSPLNDHMIVDYFSCHISTNLQTLHIVE